MNFGFSVSLILLVNWVLSAHALLHNNPITNAKRIQRSSKLFDVPLELTGKLDPTKSWDVKFIFQGKEKTVKLKEDTSFLECGENIFDDVPSSCRNGVCTTCAGKVSLFILFSIVKIA